MFNPLLKEMIAHKVESPPVIDAHLSDPAWQSSDIASEFFNLDNERPGNTTVWVACHDSHFLYLGLICQGDQAVASNHEGKTATGDSVEIDLAPDARLGWNYRFCIGPAASRLAAKPGASLSKPGLNWKVVTRPTPTGWSAEMALPFASLLPGGSPSPKRSVLIKSGSVWFLRVFRHAVSRNGKVKMSSWTRLGIVGKPDSAIYGHLFFDTRNAKAADRSIRMIEPWVPEGYRPREGARIKPGEVFRPNSGLRWPVEPAAKLYQLQLSQDSHFPPGRTSSFESAQPHVTSTFIPVSGKWYWRYRMRTFDDRLSSFSRARAFVVLKTR